MRGRTIGELNCEVHARYEKGGGNRNERGEYGINSTLFQPWQTLFESVYKDEN